MRRIRTLGTSFPRLEVFGKCVGPAQVRENAAVRVVYFYIDDQHPLYLLLVYPKAKQEDLSAAEKRLVRALTMLLKGRRKPG